MVDGEAGLGERGRAQRMGRIRREKGTERWDGEDGLVKIVLMKRNKRDVIRLEMKISN
jgi:hypothetical protein